MINISDPHVIIDTIFDDLKCKDIISMYTWFYALFAESCLEAKLGFSFDVNTSPLYLYWYALITILCL